MLSPVSFLRKPLLSLHSNISNPLVLSRAQFPAASLADLYDPNTMPPVLVKAHQTLDKAVNLCYRSQPFIAETKRIEFLFELFDKYTSGIFVTEKKFKIKKTDLAKKPTKILF